MTGSLRPTGGEPRLWVVGLFLALAFLFFIAAAGTFEKVNIGFGTGGKVMANAPHTSASPTYAVSSNGPIALTILS